MSKAYTGGCTCGAIRYEINVEPIMAGHCQCRDCQRMTGTGHASCIAFPADVVRLTGVPTFHAVKADSGNMSSRGFCAKCGCFVLAKGEAMPNMLIVTAGSLDDPSRFVPQLIVYTSRGQTWDKVDPTLMSFARMPPPAGMPESVCAGNPVAGQKAAFPPAS
jgi:hypothetical protein